MLNMMVSDGCFSETLLTVSVHACDELELRVHVCCSQFSRTPPHRERFRLFRTVVEGHSQKDSKGVFTESCALTVQEVSVLCLCPLRGLQLSRESSWNSMRRSSVNVWQLKLTVCRRVQKRSQSFNGPTLQSGKRWLKCSGTVAGCLEVRLFFCFERRWTFASWIHLRYESQVMITW